MQGSKLKRAASIAEGAGHKSRTAGQPPGHLARYRPHARVAHIRHCRQPLRARRALYQGRDLAPTLDLRSVLKGLLQEHLLVPPRELERTVFPDSSAARPLSGLVRRT
ncbi:MAG TPA: hypothetical protein VK128_03535 [Steroidobacteraceae bacterium]|nr:hypothetical protein [Steroidobacteraceae bacterium]